MTDNELTPAELETLRSFQSPTQPVDVDPHHFAKLLSLALIEQREGGPELTQSGIERVNNSSDSAPGLQ